ncbi:hypothetical protein [Flavobacterium sp. J27]|uniref:hypothetical protein n=1 Tax=Flavobacterium sp. J27 TaxID=2060419 RepID=UPI001030DBC9|nr:hypothetical protein [Flavobacterium sp. J27]
MKSLETLRLKLKRHKIHFFYNESLNQIEIGKSLNSNQKKIIGIALIIIGLLLFILAIGLLVDIGVKSKLLIKIFMLFPIGLIYFGGTEINKTSKLKKSNKKKIISPSAIHIEEEAKVIQIQKEQILTLDYLFEKADDMGETAGSIYVTSTLSDNKIILLTIYGTQREYLKTDLIFIKSVLSEYMQLQNIS